MSNRIFVIDTNVLVAGLITSDSNSPTHNAIWRDPPPDTNHNSPDPQDTHLWALLASEPTAILITGDQMLIEKPRPRSSVISPATWVKHFLD